MKKEWTMEETVKMPVIALRGLTVFPNVLIHFDVSREISIKALEEAMASGDPVFLVGQKDIGVEYPEAKDLYTVGTVSNVRQILRTPGDNVRVMVEGGARGSLKRLLRSAPFLEAEVQPIQEEKAGQNSAKTEALIRSTYEMFRQYTELAPKTAPDLLINVLASEDPGYIADFIAQNIAMRNSDKQAILEELRPVRRLERLYRLLTREVEILGLDMEIQNRAREQMADNQREDRRGQAPRRGAGEAGEGAGPAGQAALRLLRGHGPAQLSGRVPGAPLGQEDPRAGERGGGPEGPGPRPLRPGQSEGAHSGVPGCEAAGP